MGCRRSRSLRPFPAALCAVLLAAGRGWAAADTAAAGLPGDTARFAAGLLGVLLLGALGWAVRLRRRVQQASASLAAAREQLEDRVRARTAELDAANRGLREEAEARLRAEAALAETEERFRTAFRTSPDSININRLEDGLYEDINEGFTEITGYTADEVIGRTSLDLDIWADPKDRTRLVEGLRRDGVVRNLETRFRMKDGRVIRGLISARVIDFAGVPHILSVARNIEAWAQAREALRESEARLRSVIESMPCEFFVFDLEGQCTIVNSRARACWGDTVGRPVGEIPDDTQIGTRWEEGFHRALAGATTEDDWERKSGGARVVYHSVIAPIGGPDGIVGVQALNMDVTERQELEVQLSRAQKMEAVGTLASGVAHDFNNLLQGILGFAELAAQEPDLPEPALAHLGRIEAAANSAAELVRSLLTYGRREKPQLDRFDLNRPVETVVAMLRRTIPKMISVETRLAHDLEPCRGDARQLEQVLLNLGTNARDAMPGGGVLTYETATVTLAGDSEETRSGPPPGRYVRCTVTDTGAGMDEETAQRIFD
ncbi:MAG TPA: PAS domain S-box protein, partial [Deferrisomatales bacterium]|nr:PAS domain S-box protein [Deferrisomatales bacterium]